MVAIGAEMASHSLRIDASSAAERCRVATAVSVFVVACLPSSPRLRGVALMLDGMAVEAAAEHSSPAPVHSSVGSL